MRCRPASSWRPRRPRTSGARWSPRASTASDPRPATALAPRTIPTGAAGWAWRIPTPARGRVRGAGAGARLGVEVVVVNPSYVFGPAVAAATPASLQSPDRQLSARPAPAVVDSETNAVDVRDVAAGHLLAAERGAPGERYVLGGDDLRWVELSTRWPGFGGARRARGAAAPGRRAGSPGGGAGPGLSGGGRGRGADGRDGATRRRRRVAPRLPRRRSTAPARHDLLVPGAIDGGTFEGGAARRCRRRRWG